MQIEQNISREPSLNEDVFCVKERLSMEAENARSVDTRNASTPSPSTTRTLRRKILDCQHVVRQDHGKK